MANSVFENIRVGNHLYVFYKGELIYKRWYDEYNNKLQPSCLFNVKFPISWIVEEDKEENKEKNNEFPI